MTISVVMDEDAVESRLFVLMEEDAMKVMIVCGDGKGTIELTIVSWTLDKSNDWMLEMWLCRRLQREFPFYLSNYVRGYILIDDGKKT